MDRARARRRRAPTIHFGTGTAGLLEELAAAGGDAIGLDWRLPLDEGWARVPDRAVQGNLDPAALLAPWDVVEREALDVLAGRRAGRATSSTSGTASCRRPTRTLTRLVALVRERRPRRCGMSALRLGGAWSLLGGWSGHHSSDGGARHAPPWC